MNSLDVRMGHIAVGEDSKALVASGVGSCVVVTLYDAKRRIGAMAHAMFPPTSRPHGCRPDTRYVDAAIDAMLEKLLARGARKEYLEAKIVGGANMFADFESDMGQKNVAGAKAKLRAEGIRLIGECVGGSTGRSVEFCPASGILTVKVKF